MLDRLARAVTGNAMTLVVVAVLLSAASLARLVDVNAIAERRWAHALRLEIDPSMTSVLPTDDPARRYHDSIREIFGNDETLLLVVRPSPDLFTPAALAALERTSDAIAELGGIREVMSLASTDNIRAVDGEIVVAPLFDEAPRTAAEAERVRRELFANPVLADGLVSEDGRTTAIVAYLDDLSELEVLSSEIDRRTLEIARAEFGPEAEIWLSGGAHLKAETQRILFRDMRTTMPAIVFLLMTIAYFSFRTLRGVVVPMLSLGLAILWTLALASLFSPRLNLVTSSAPAILLAVGFAYTVHIMTAYYEVANERGQGKQGVLTDDATEALRRVGLPTLLTSLTTAAGFLSIALSPIPAIREFGLLCATGILCLLVVNWTFVPALLSLMRDESRAPDARPKASLGTDWIERLLERVARFDIGHRRAIFATAGILFLASALAIPSITISTDLLRNFPPDLPVRRSIESINQNLGGADQIYVVLESEDFDAFKDPDTLRALDDLQTWLEGQPEVGGTSSVASYVKLLHRAFNDDDPAFYSIPDSQPLVSQLLLIGANDDLDRLVDTEFAIARIPIRINVFDSGSVAALADRIEARLERMPIDLTGRVTGLSVLVARTNDEIAYGQAVSLASAFFIIWAILSLLFTSPRIGFLAMIPNLLPVVVYFGALGWTGTSLNVVTGLVACLVLGIAVDDTIHFLARFNTLARERADAKAGALEALLEVGRAVTYTSAALCAGFFALTASTLQQQVQFGALAAFTLAVAWLVDITFTPALASGLRVVTLWDLLAVDLGKDPVHSIGLFEGLRPRQARVVALMGSLIDAPAGRTLFGSGEPSEGLFVVIAGSVRTWIDAGDRNLADVQHPLGDTVGEVGLFHGHHHANAEVEKNARLLRLSARAIRDIEQRYPRIAAIVLRNLAGLMASRLALQTEGQRLGEAFARPHPANSAWPRRPGFALGNPELEASLASLGIHDQTQRALGLIPMVEIAWADGQLAPQERIALLDLAGTLGLDEAGESYALLSSWLESKPDPAIFAAWRAYVAILLPELSIEGQLRLRSHVVERARTIAGAAGGLAGLRKVSLRERRAILAVESVFDPETDEP